MSRMVQPFLEAQPRPAYRPQFYVYMVALVCEWQNRTRLPDVVLLPPTCWRQLTWAMRPGWGARAMWAGSVPVALAQPPIRRCHPWARKSTPQAVISRMQLTFMRLTEHLSALRASRFALGASNVGLVGETPTFSVPAW